MTYIRHRVRMVHESVVEDLIDTLIACRWLPGTTTREVNNPGGTFEQVTVADDEVFALIADNPLTVLNYFPDPTDGPPSLNTLAIDMPRPADSQTWELGSNLSEQPYQFSMVLYADSDATAVALFSDLQDRYAGRIINGESIALYDYLTDANTIHTLMSVEAFRYARDAETVAPHEVHTYYAELEITDFV